MSIHTADDSVNITIDVGSFIMASLIGRELRLRSNAISLFPVPFVQDTLGLLDGVVTNARVLLPKRDIEFIEDLLDQETDFIICLERFLCIERNSRYRYITNQLISTIGNYIKNRPEWVGFLTGIEAESLSKAVVSGLSIFSEFYALTDIEKKRKGTTNPEVMIRIFQEHISFMADELVPVSMKQWESIVTDKFGPVSLLQTAIYLPIVGPGIKKAIRKYYGIRDDDMINIGQALVKLAKPIVNAPDSRVRSVGKAKIGLSRINLIEKSASKKGRDFRTAIHRMQQAGSSMAEMLGQGYQRLKGCIRV